MSKVTQNEEEFRKKQDNSNLNKITFQPVVRVPQDQKQQSIEWPVMQQKKSKIDMLRQKIRLKKLASQQQSISQSQQRQQEFPYKRLAEHELTNPQKQSVQMTKGQKIISTQIQKGREQQGNSKTKEVEEKLHGQQQTIIIPVQQKTTEQKQQAPKSTFLLQPPTINHTLFYQLNQLNECLLANTTALIKNQAQITDHKNKQHKVKQFVQELKKLKTNMNFYAS